MVRVWVYVDSPLLGAPPQGATPGRHPRAQGATLLTVTVRPTHL